ncbi:sensor histidine kinase [Streptomyces sp. NPDC046876]|uniref:sensor histidine kinase n=1 Tax=Streptomyces sp. NPDC046876 TaxID=3155616 RepID=UPI0033FE2C02
MDTSSGAVARRPTAHRLQTAALWAGAGLAALLFGQLTARGPLGFGGQIIQPGSVLAVLGILLAAVLLRRAPLVTLALMLLNGAFVLFLSNSPGLTFAMVAPAAAALGRVAATRTRRTAALAAAATILVLIAGQFAIPATSRPELVLTQSELPIVIAAWLIGDSVRRSRESAARAHARATEQALTDERLRIARELHDMVAHSIGVIAIQAGVGSRVIGKQPERARESLQAIEATSRETLASLRRTLVALRRSEPAALAPAPGLDGLDRLVAATAEDTGVQVELVWSGSPRPLPQEIELAAYRIVQEALTNVVRHAGAGRCRVELAYGDGELGLEITDDGRGLPHGGPGSGFGITGMRERAELLGGRLEAGPLDGGGFRVAAALPLGEEETKGETRGEGR